MALAGNRGNNVLNDEGMAALKYEMFQLQRRCSNLENRLATQGLRRHQAVYMPGSEPVKFRNDYAGEVPAYAVMRVTGTAEVGGKVILTIDQPNTDFGRLYLVNGKKTVADDGYGVGTWLWDADWVLYDDANTPAAGESWGPQASSWELKKYRYGFTIVGGATGDSTDRVKASQHWVNGFIGKTDASHAKSATGTISVYDGNRVDTSINVSSVYNLFAAVATTKFVDVEWRGGTWYLTSAEC
jgi:hypothetical protein